jgi:hypothetical protein
MISFYLFILSALVIVTMLVAKRIEEKKRASVLLLKLVSRGDERARVWYNQALQHYSIGKEKAEILVKKQLPLRTRHLLNKAISYSQELSAKYLGDVRNSRLLKRSDGISEFFKSISEVEKGTGEINETFINEAESLPDVQELTQEVVEAVETTFIEPIQEVLEKPKKAPRKRSSAPRAPRRKKLVVVEAVE